MADNRCIRIYDLKQKIKYHPDIGTYISEEDIDLMERVYIEDGKVETYDNINEESKWHDFNENQPTKIGLYNVKVGSSFFGDDYDNISGSVVRWDGEDFLLSIGRPITDEVLYWKEI